MTELLTAALSYVEMGWSVFPCQPRGKKPLTAHGFKDASTDIKQVNTWWSRYPDANIGLACGASGLDVLDVDGPDGIATLNNLESRHGALTPTLTVQTGGGGLHYYYTHNPSQPFATRARFAPGLDTRGEGGYTILPPSIHSSGGLYNFLCEVPPAPAPDWLVTLVRSGSKGAPALTDPPLNSERLIKTFDPNTGKEPLTAWAKMAKKKLKGRTSYDLSFTEYTADEGSRDSTLTAAVGECISMLCAERGTTPEHIYALLKPAAERFSDWPTALDWLWEKVCRFWEQDASKREAEAIQAEAEQKQTQEQYDATESGMLAGLTTWLPAAIKPDRAWLQSHLIAALPIQGAAYYCLRRDGLYDPLGVPLVQLPARIRQLGLDQMIQLTEPNADGSRMVPVSGQSLLTNYSTSINSIKGSIRLSGCAQIRKIDTPDAELIVPTFSRKIDLTPTFIPEVDEWLHATFRGHYGEVRTWIGHSLAFDEGPICALSLVGRASLGKTLLAMGLAECITSETVATARDLLSDYQYGLLRSPFVWIDEGLPDSITRKPADAFRDLVGGNRQFINQKHRAVIEMACPRRLLITANNPNVIMELCNNKNMMRPDREAVGLRLHHIDLGDDDAGAKWLNDRGGLAYTGAEGARWIAGSAEQPSDYLVAKHFLWFYENRGKAPGKRLLMEGDPQAYIIEEMRMDTGLVGFTAHMIIEMLNALERRRPLPGCAMEDGLVKVTSAQVVAFWQESYPHITKKDINVTTIGHTLSGMAARQTNPVRLKSRPQAGKVRWFEILPEELWRLAQRHGYSCPTLEKLADPTATPAPPNRVAKHL
jgi:Bifunctional DNA primase/polymerase, N-terminal